MDDVARNSWCIKAYVGQAVHIVDTKAVLPCVGQPRTLHRCELDTPFEGDTLRGIIRSVDETKVVVESSGKFYEIPNAVQARSGCEEIFTSTDEKPMDSFEVTWPLLVEFRSRHKFDLKEELYEGKILVEVKGIYETDEAAKHVMKEKFDLYNGSHATVAFLLVDTIMATHMATRNLQQFFRDAIKFVGDILSRFEAITTPTHIRNVTDEFSKSKTTKARLNYMHVILGNGTGLDKKESAKREANKEIIDFGFSLIERYLSSVSSGPSAPVSSALVSSVSSGPSGPSTPVSSAPVSHQKEEAVKRTRIDFASRVPGERGVFKHIREYFETHGELSDNDNGNLDLLFLEVEHALDVFQLMSTSTNPILTYINVDDIRAYTLERYNPPEVSMQRVKLDKEKRDVVGEYLMVKGWPILSFHDPPSDSPSVRRIQAQNYGVENALLPQVTLNEVVIFYQREDESGEEQCWAFVPIMDGKPVLGPSYERGAPVGADGADDRSFDADDAEVLSAFDEEEGEGENEEEGEGEGEGGGEEEGEGENEEEGGGEGEGEEESEEESGGKIQPVYHRPPGESAPSRSGRKNAVHSMSEEEVAAIFRTKNLPLTLKFPSNFYDLAEKEQKKIISSWENQYELLKRGIIEHAPRFFYEYLDYLNDARIKETLDKERQAKANESHERKKEKLAVQMAEAQARRIDRPKRKSAVDGQDARRNQMADDDEERPKSKPRRVYNYDDLSALDLDALTAQIGDGDLAKAFADHDKTEKRKTDLDGWNAMVELYLWGGYKREGAKTERVKTKFDELPATLTQALSEHIKISGMQGVTPQSGKPGEAEGKRGYQVQKQFSGDVTPRRFATVENADVGAVIFIAAMLDPNLRHRISMVPWIKWISDPTIDPEEREGRARQWLGGIDKDMLDNPEYIRNNPHARGRPRAPGGLHDRIARQGRQIPATSMPVETEEEVAKRSIRANVRQRLSTEENRSVSDAYIDEMLVQNNYDPETTYQEIRGAQSIDLLGDLDESSFPPLAAAQPTRYL